LFFIDYCVVFSLFFFFQAEDGIRDFCLSRGLGMCIRDSPEGSLIGWKKCENSRIVKLRIPEDAKRSHAFGRKCRAERAEVVAVYGTNNAPCKSAVASYDSSSVYRVGETVVPRNGFSEDWQSECEAGIHFYITREEAEAH